jgi:pimeloyl-ACP methyl ester carboxylesterase
MAGKRRTLPRRRSQNLTFPDTGSMMSRLLALFALFCCSMAHAASPVVSQRPIDLDVPGGQLHGSLLVPQSSKPLPVVLIIAGSGPTDRDGNNPEGGHNDYLRRLALLLAANDIASVRYDKRGVASGLPLAPDERSLNVESYVADAVAWGRKLNQDPRFSKLIILGHSEGALVASLAAPEAGAAAMISLAGSGRPVDQVLREQLQQRVPAALLPRSETLIANLKAGHLDTEVPKPLQVVFRPSVQPYLISLFRQDPAKAYAALQMPVLIVQGRNDIQVGVKDALALQAAQPKAELALIDGMNHVLRIVPMDMKAQVASYRNATLPLADALGKRVVEFIDQQR